MPASGSGCRARRAAKRALAARLVSLPRIARALGEGRLGVEAALQLVRIATPHTEAAWLERAMLRTLKHLREEVAAAQMAVRLSGDPDCPPSLEAELQAFHELERAVVSGRAGEGGGHPAGGATELGQGRSGRDGEEDSDRAGGAMESGEGRRERMPHCTPAGATTSGTSPPSPSRHHREERGSASAAVPSRERRAWLVMLASLRRWLEGGVQMSAARRPRRGAGAAGRIPLRLRVDRSLFLWWRGLEAQAQRWLPAGVSWLRFLCLTLWRAWRHLLGADVAYGGIYVRDRCRCTSPVCSRKDVTPHHLRFRSAGGGDEDENVAAVCVWCHLLGIHGGRIRATGTANDIRWELGRPPRPCVVVHGRERRAA